MKQRSTAYRTQSCRHPLWVVLLVGLSACATAPAERSGPPAASSTEEASSSARRSPLKEPPGVYFAEVTQDTIQTTICVSGWTATIRPSTSFTNGLKQLMLSRAGLSSGDASNYELDHYVPLALGGHPRSEDNLWLQPWNGTWSAKVKDRLERRLQVMVCAGEVTLHAAQQAIQKGWRAAYRKFVAVDPLAISQGMESEDDEVVE